MAIVTDPPLLPPAPALLSADESGGPTPPAPPFAPEPPQASARSAGSAPTATTRLPLRSRSIRTSVQRLRGSLSSIPAPEQVGRVLKCTAKGVDSAMDLLFADGVSTASTVTEISGRGVGMGALRATVQQLGGEIVVQPGDGGRGTRIAMRFPDPR